MLPNDWKRIRVHYTNWREDIMRAGRNEWGMDAYAWADGFIHLTPIEDYLWEHIRECDAVLYPQYPVGRFFVDFANPVARVAIECDGAAYHTDKAKDAARDAQLAALGWTVYRITGSDCVHQGNWEEQRPSRAHQFIERICETHGISRFTRTAEDVDSEWLGWSEDSVGYFIHAMEIRAATREGIIL